MHTQQRSAAMSLSCRFGDDEATETVPCRLDSTDNTVHCRQTVGNRRLPLRDFRMEVTLVNEGEDEDETSSLIARPDQSRTESTAVTAKSRCPDLRHSVLRTTMAALLGEFIGTCMLTLVICTSVAVSVVAGESFYLLVEAV